MRVLWGYEAGQLQQLLGGPFKAGGRQGLPADWLQARVANTVPNVCVRFKPHPISLPAPIAEPGKSPIKPAEPKPAAEWAGTAGSGLVSRAVADLNSRSNSPAPQRPSSSAGGSPASAMAASAALSRAAAQVGRSSGQWSPRASPSARNNSVPLPGLAGLAQDISQPNTPAKQVPQPVPASDSPPVDLGAAAAAALQARANFDAAHNMFGSAAAGDEEPVLAAARLHVSVLAAATAAHDAPVSPAAAAAEAAVSAAAAAVAAAAEEMEAALVAQAAAAAEDGAAAAAAAHTAASHVADAAAASAAAEAGVAAATHADEPSQGSSKAPVLPPRSRASGSAAEQSSSSAGRRSRSSGAASNSISLQQVRRQAGRASDATGPFAVVFKAPAIGIARAADGIGRVSSGIFRQFVPLLTAPKVLFTARAAGDKAIAGALSCLLLLLAGTSVGLMDQQIKGSADSSSKRRGGSRKPAASKAAATKQVTSSAAAPAVQPAPAAVKEAAPEPAAAAPAAAAPAAHEAAASPREASPAASAAPAAAVEGPKAAPAVDIKLPGFAGFFNKDRSGGSPAPEGAPGPSFFEAIRRPEAVKGSCKNPEANADGSMPNACPLDLPTDREGRAYTQKVLTRI